MHGAQKHQGLVCGYTYSSRRDWCRKIHRTSSSFLLKINRTPTPYNVVPDAEQPNRQVAYPHFGQPSPKAQRFVSPLRSQGDAENRTGARHTPHRCHQPKGVGKPQGGQDLCQHKPPRHFSGASSYAIHTCRFLQAALPFQRLLR